MTKDEKVKVIKEIKALLQGAKVVYVADLEGLNAAKTSDLRRQAFKKNIHLRVVKNTLLKKAMEEITDVDYKQMFETFKGNTAVMIAETANAPAKLIKDFRKKDAKPAVKAAFLQETFYIGDENLDMLASIKSKEEMLGDIIGLLQSPIRNILSALQNKASKEGEEAPESAE